CLDPLDRKCVPEELLAARSKLPGGGERDFFWGSQDLVAPQTCDAVRLDDMDCKTASAFMNEVAVNSGPSVGSASSDTGLSTTSAVLNEEGNAYASSVSGDAAPKRAVTSVYAVCPVVDADSFSRSLVPDEVTAHVIVGNLLYG
ncbi:MAG: hypothetical protein ACKPKO_65575, partial [Candidatus Fonsibacter sp.]